MKEGRERSLAEANPKLAAEWHPTLNGSLTPADVAPSSSRKVWWLGPCGHEWETSVGTRRRGSRCPFCYGRRVKEGFNDLATTHPRLAAEWHPERNGGLEPTGIKAGSQRRVWWKCSVCGHEWQAIVASRRNGGGRRLGEWWRFELSRAAGGAVETDFAVCKAPDAASAHAQIARMADAGWAVVAVRRAATFSEASAREGVGDGR